MADNNTSEMGNEAMPTPRTTHTAASITRAHRRCAELAELNPKWPQARVRKTVAGELGVTTVTLRYLLGK